MREARTFAEKEENEMSYSESESRRLASRAVALVLAGGRGSRLKDLTDQRAKPAVHFGGKYRIVDFALSNCINSGVRRIYVLTQYKSHSLLRHIQRGWSFLRGEMHEFIDLLPAQQRIDETTWYRGTADAVWQNVDILTAENPEYIIVLAGDHIYKMDYSVMLEQHVRTGARLTVGCVEVPREEARGFGVMHVDAEGRIKSFLEKPSDPPPMPGTTDISLASMGIYVFDAKFLYEVLRRDATDQTSTHDFGRDFIPSLVDRGEIWSHRFSESCVRARGLPSYWRDVGTVDAYWEANLDLTRVTPELNLYDPEWRIFTASRQLPPAKFVFDDDERRGQAVDSVIAGGTIISGGTVEGSLISRSVRVNSFSSVKRSVVLPECSIGRGARINHAVIDRGVYIPPGMVIGEDPELDAARFYRTSKGVTLVTQAMLDRLEGHHK